MIYLHGKPITPILNPFNQAQAVDVEEVTQASCPYTSRASRDRIIVQIDRLCKCAMQAVHASSTKCILARISAFALFVG